MQRGQLGSGPRPLQSFERIRRPSRLRRFSTLF
jgi:hypothetical protein